MPSLAQTCPTEDPAIDSAKSNKLFLYFPTSSDSSFPSYDTLVSPAQPFSAAQLSSGAGTTTQFIDEIRKIVADDYCEFNVQVLSTTTNPATQASPPPRRTTVAIGSDVNGNSSGATWGESQEVDTGDTIAIDFARVWAGTYTVCEGGNGPAATGLGCSNAGALTGSNNTLLNWAQAIGSTAAHEAGHTYGLAHSDDDPNPDPCNPTQVGPTPLPGEDDYTKHLMPSGCNITGPERTTYRRHFSDRDYGLLATNVGLSVETMHNWNLVNPNAEAASSLQIDFLSMKPSLTISWSYGGASSPWLNPAVSGPSGTAMFKGQTYKKYRVTWSSANPAWTTSSPGVVAGGAVFHVGTTFTGVDFNQPDPVIIQDVTLLDASGAALALHPRLPSYDAGTLDATRGLFVLNFYAPPDAPGLRLQSATIMQLPRIATIDSMVGGGRPYAREGQPIRAWSSARCEVGLLRDVLACPIARLRQPPHVQAAFRLGERGVYDCRQGVPRVPARGAGTGNPSRDSTFSPDYEGPVLPQPGSAPPGGIRDSVLKPDYEGPICAGAQRDPFPATVVYVVATFVDPRARHFDADRKDYVEGPVVSKLYYQFAGIRRLPERRPYDR